MSTLHTVNKSPFTNTALISCLSVCTEKDSILLLEDGVFGAIPGAPSSAQFQSQMARGVNIFALSEDVAARGITQKILRDIRLISYDDFVSLSTTHERIQSWY
jgi:tRNA 2-thiouridine synthesizing protein B